MTGVQLGIVRAALAVALCALPVSAVLSSASTAATSAGATPHGCSQWPAWIESPAAISQGESSLPSCFSSASGQAEAVLSIVNNRPYAQLITVSGATLNLTGSSFHGSLETALARLLASTGPSRGLGAFLLGPGRDATLAIDRPAPGPAQIVHIDPAPDNAFAVGALAWDLLSAGAKHVRAPVAAQGCIAAAVGGAVAGVSGPERALRRFHACVDASSGAARAELRKLAARVLRNRSFRQIIHREGSERHPARIAYTVAASNPYLANGAIQLGASNLGALPAGRLTVRHLSASGGAPPYRYYLVPEPGGPGVPSWLHLAADGTLMIEPPAGTNSIVVPVEVVDSNGEHSVVAY